MMGPPMFTTSWFCLTLAAYKQGESSIRNHAGVSCVRSVGQCLLSVCRRPGGEGGRLCTVESVSSGSCIAQFLRTVDKKKKKRNRERKGFSSIWRFLLGESDSLFLSVRKQSPPFFFLEHYKNLILKLHLVQ